MGKNVALWRGAKGMVEDPSSPIDGNNKDGATETRIFNGPYDLLAANVPARLTIVQGSSAGLYVDVTKLEKLPGNRGRLTIDLSSNPFADPGADTLELEWVEIQKPLLQHPRYQPGGAMALTMADLDAISEWQNAATATLRSAAFAKLSTQAQDYANKVMRGTEAYVVYSPVCRTTTKSPSMPACGDCGKISAPTGGQPGGTYVYLKTADRRTRQDRLWVRTQEWTGAAAWDTDLYSS